MGGRVQGRDDSALIQGCNEPCNNRALLLIMVKILNEIEFSEYHTHKTILTQTSYNSPKYIVNVVGICTILTENRKKIITVFLGNIRSDCNVNMYQY